MVSEYLYLNSLQLYYLFFVLIELRGNLLMCILTDLSATVVSVYTAQNLSVV